MKMKDLHFYHICKAIVFTICFLIVIYMAKKEIARFWENKDTSSVGIKSFHQTDDENIQFPTFSICFHQGYVMYSSKDIRKLIRKFGWNIKMQSLIRDARHVLEGSRPYNQTIAEKFSDFSSLTIKLKNLIRKYQIGDENSHIINRWNDSVKDQNLPFAVSYQTTRFICFTLEDELPNNINKMEDVIWFKTSALKKLLWHGRNSKSPGWMYFYMHAKGQLIRSLDKPIFRMHVVNLTAHNFDVAHTIAVKRVDVLQGRKDGIIPCRSYTTNEDMEYLMTAIKAVECVPVYWKAINISGGNHRLCNTTEQYKKLHENYNGYHPTPKIWVKLKWVPCYEMVVSSVLNTEASNHFRLHIRYQDLGSRYFETVNSRDFGFENLWSSFGGIVGIFLGYSIMNVFEMISNGLKWMHSKLEGKNKS